MIKGLAKREEKAQVSTLLEGYRKERQPQANSEAEVEGRLALAEKAELLLKKGDLTYLGAAFLGFSALVVFFLLGTKGVLLFLGIAALFLVWSKNKKEQKRALNFEKDFPPFLMSLSSSIKTGQDPLSAVINSTELFPADSELGKSLEKFKEAIELGFTEEEAIQEFAKEINHPDIALFRIAFLLARKEGASLSAALRRLAKVTRARQSFRRKIRAAVAMQKLSSYGIIGSALVIAGIQAASNPAAIKAAIEHPIGIKALGLGVGLMALGLFWMLSLTKSKV